MAGIRQNGQSRWPAKLSRSAAGNSAPAFRPVRISQGSEPFSPTVGPDPVEAWRRMSAKTSKLLTIAILAPRGLSRDLPSYAARVGFILTARRGFRRNPCSPSAPLSERAPHARASRSAFRATCLILVAMLALLCGGPARAQYQPIPNFTGVGAGQQFRNAVNGLGSGATPISPRLVAVPFSILNVTPEQDGQ